MYTGVSYVLRSCAGLPAAGDCQVLLHVISLHDIQIMYILVINGIFNIINTYITIQTHQFCILNIIWFSWLACNYGLFHPLYRFCFAYISVYIFSVILPINMKCHKASCTGNNVALSNISKLYNICS